MTASDTVSKKAAREVLARIKKGGKHTLAQEAQHLGLSFTRPLKVALVEACGGQEAYQKMMVGRKYPRKTKEERAAAAERKVADVKRTLLAAGVKKVVVKKKVVAPASKKKREAGVVAVEFSDGSAVEDDDDGGIAEDDEEAEGRVVDCGDEMSSGGRGRAWAEEYWSSGDTQAEVDGGAGTAVVS